MIKKLVLTDIFRSDKDKTGKPFVTKDGRPYQRVLIKTAEYGNEVLLSGFGGAWNSDWKSGEEITVDVVEVKKDEKTYYNFSKVNMEVRMMEMITDLNNRVRKLEADAAKGYYYPEAKNEPKPDLKEINDELDILSQEEIDNIRN